ncbi:MAG: sugar transferase [Patescibacteria group bacterium]|nr:sugar transferase [Patescibacteria group bacterium]MDD5121302.1 sugar transferase [Patescibacteria group bacterium]MDD5221732.1 sugar transferase [Patescibacteria group bacterium]MDD5395779.1 sugar transferase [Patescibacteria group bacterium]
MLNLSRAAKRTIDVVFSSGALIILSPLFLLIILGIKVSSPNGPLFFRQERVGYHGKIFRIWKFRTMSLSPSNISVDQTIRYELSGHDPRVFLFGFWLRRSHMDEIPQLFNVIRGDMSFVGPRPFFLPRVHANSRLKGKRTDVLPGMTGPSQLYIYKNKTISDEKIIELDEDYIQRWSLWSDFIIFCQTIRYLLLRF